MNIRDHKTQKIREEEGCSSDLQLAASAPSDLLAEGKGSGNLMISNLLQHQEVLWSSICDQSEMKKRLDLPSKWRVLCDWRYHFYILQIRLQINLPCQYGKGTFTGTFCFFLLFSFFFSPGLFTCSWSSSLESQCVQVSMTISLCFHWLFFWIIKLLSKHQSIWRAPLSKITYTYKSLGIGWEFWL